MGDISHVIALSLLIGALAAFLLSTRQLSLRRRSIIWGIGATFTAVAAVVGLSEQGGADLIRILSIAWSDDEIDFSRNWKLIGGYFSPALNVLFVLCVVIGIIAVIAFTPGEEIERHLRRLGLVVAGAVVGVIVSFASIIIGVGGNAKRAVFVGAPSLVNCEEEDRDRECDVIDGDTFLMGDISLRLLGIDTPGLGNPGAREAREALIELVGDGTVVCYEPRSELNRKINKVERRIPRETFGRPLVACKAFKASGERLDLAEEMLKRGFARACQCDGHPGDDYARILKDAETVGHEYWSVPLRCSERCEPLQDFDT